MSSIDMFAPLLPLREKQSIKVEEVITTLLFHWFILTCILYIIGLALLEIKVTARKQAKTPNMYSRLFPIPIITGLSQEVEPSPAI